MFAMTSTSAAEAGDDVDERGGGGLQTLRFGMTIGGARGIEESRVHAEIGCVVAHHQEIERWTRDAKLRPVRVGNRLAFGVAVGIVRRRAHPSGHERVHRVIGVDVRVAKVSVCRVRAVGGVGDDRREAAKEEVRRGKVEMMYHDLAFNP
jgi:hypothetical protein